MDEAVSTRVICEVAEEKHVDPADLPPLGRVIDADAIDALFEDGRSTADCEISFSYAGCRIRIRDGTVTVGRRSRPLAAPSTD